MSSLIRVPLMDARMMFVFSGHADASVNLLEQDLAPEM